MSEPKGWIKLHRSILDSPYACKDGDYLSVWIYLLLNATHQPVEKIFKGTKIILKPGQLITGRKKISSVLSVSESKIERVLKCYNTEQQIEQQTSNKSRLITILNWNKYQQAEQQIEQQMDNNWTTTGQQLDTNKKLRIKEAKNKKEKSTKEKYLETVFLSNEEYKKLKEKLGEIALKKKIDDLDYWHMENPKDHKKDHYRTILRWYNRDQEKKQQNGISLYDPKELCWIEENGKVVKKTKERNVHSCYKRIGKTKEGETVWKKL